MPKQPLPTWQKYAAVALFALSIGAAAMLMLVRWGDDACPFCGAPLERQWDSRSSFFRAYRCGTLSSTGAVGGCRWTRSGICVERGGKNASAVGGDEVRMPKETRLSERARALGFKE